MNFAQKLQKRRKEVGFSQEQLAFELNVSVRLCPSGKADKDIRSRKIDSAQGIAGDFPDELMKETREHPQPL